ncbi:MAG: hypothetical protein K2Q22_17785, partial [Cytophagales bacterium]|nr:hypothetical protein [Cytophagales bacterium]
MRIAAFGFMFFCATIGTISEIYGQRYFVKSYSVTEGLSEALVYDICEDTFGNIWIATQGGGINKFDGHSFFSYKTCNGLPNNYVTKLLWSSQNQLWMTTWDGVVIFDGKSFKQAFHSVFRGKFMVSILEDRKGNIWIQPETGGVYVFNGKKLIHFNKKSGFTDEFIDYMWLDPTTDELYFCVSQDKAVYVYSKGKFRVFSPSGLPDSLEISSICRQGNRFWFGTYQGITSLENGAYLEHWKGSKAAQSAIASIELDKAGHVWFASIHGVVRYDGRKFEELTENQGFTNAPVRRIFVDSKNTVWFATFADGIKSFFYSPFRSISKADGLKSYGVMSINQDSSGNVWFGQAGEGMIRFEENNKPIYPPGWKFPNSLIRCSLTDKEGDVWCGTTFGLFHYHKDKIFQEGKEEGFEHESIRCGMLASDGRLWWGCKEGIIKIYNKQTQHFTSIPLPIDKGVFGVIYCFLELDKTTVLVGTSVGLFSVSNGKAIKVELKGYSHERINCLVKGKGNEIWLGMLDRGIAVYDLKTNLI